MKWLSWLSCHDLGGKFARKEVYDYMPEATTKLRQIRDSLGVTQEAVSRRTRGIGLRTYIRAESGNRVTYDTANQILEAINSLLAEANRPPVSLDDLGLTLY
jgi:transcriptional regulator with XRE-family HTH domain